MSVQEGRRSRRRRPRRSNAGTGGASTLSDVGGEVHRGTIKWFNSSRSYGFIEAESGDEVFFHESAVVLGPGESVPTRGGTVEFEVRSSPRGPQAMNVVLGERMVAGADTPRSASAAPEPTMPDVPLEDVLDLSRRMPASWRNKGASFVYTFSIVSGRRSP